MRGSTRAAAMLAMTPQPKESPSEWNGRCVDFSRVPAYDTEFKAPYDPDFMPGWRQLLDLSNDRKTKEVWVVKCSRAGGSENLLLARLRYTIAQHPEPTLVVTGSMTAAEGFMKRRIKRGMGLAVETAEKYRRAHSLEHTIEFEDMDLRVGWATDKTITKQDGAALILGDEISLWSGQAADLLRKRTAGYSFSTVLGISSMDPTAKRATAKDPIWIEFQHGNQLEWFMPDPKTRRLFKFEIGDGGSETAGLKWSQEAKNEDGSWDLDKVRKTAFYQTPDGTKITERTRMKVVRRGKWRAMNPDAPEGIVSARYVSPMVPLKSGELGELAVGFLKAKQRGAQALKTYFYEEWAAEFTKNTERVSDSVVHDRVVSGHQKGALYFTENEQVKAFYAEKGKAAFVGVDVQQDTLYAFAVEFAEGGDHAAIGWRHVMTWDEIEQFANQCQAAAIFIDYGYARRELEVLRECAARGAGWIPCKGFDKMNMAYKQFYKDPWEGTSRQTSETSVMTWSWMNDIFKMIALDCLRGDSDRKLIMYEHPEAQLVNQLASEERIDGEWKTKQGHENHLWDCYVLCILAAVISGIYPTGYRLAAGGGDAAEET